MSRYDNLSNEDKAKVDEMIRFFNEHEKSIRETGGTDNAYKKHPRQQDWIKI